MSHGDNYVGRAGHLAVMAELLLRKWNVAIPEVDGGDDIFVVRDATRTLKCVQVKTSEGAQGRFQFKVSRTQIQTVGLDPLVFVFVLRVGVRWGYLVFRRNELEDLYAQQGFGTLVVSSDQVIFRVRFDALREAAVGGSRKTGARRSAPIVLDAYVAAWDKEFPVLRYDAETRRAR